MMSLWTVPEPLTWQGGEDLAPMRHDPDRRKYATAVVPLVHTGGVPTPRPSHWMDEAACTRIAEIPGILAKCETCPVSRQCFEYGTSKKMTGPYGGITLIEGQPSTKATW